MPPLSPGAIASCDNSAVALDFGKYCELDPHSDTGSVRSLSTRVVGSLADADGVRLSRFGVYDGDVFDVVLKFIPEGETDSRSEVCDSASCITTKLCSGTINTLLFKVQVGTRATVEFSIVLPDTDTPLSIPGTYMSMFDLDGSALDDTDGISEAVGFRGASVQVEEYYCTSCGPNVAGIDSLPARAPLPARHAPLPTHVSRPPSQYLVGLEQSWRQGGHISACTALMSNDTVEHLLLSVLVARTHLPLLCPAGQVTQPTPKICGRYLKTAASRSARGRT